MQAPPINNQKTSMTFLEKMHKNAQDSKEMTHKATTMKINPEETNPMCGSNRGHKHDNMPCDRVWATHNKILFEMSGGVPIATGYLSSQAESFGVIAMAMAASAYSETCQNQNQKK